MSRAESGETSALAEQEGSVPADVRAMRRRLILSFGVVSLSLAVGGYLYYRHQAQVLRAEKYSDLRAIADLKAGQIVQWRHERVEDARVHAAAWACWRTSGPCRGRPGSWWPRSTRRRFSRRPDTTLYSIGDGVIATGTAARAAHERRGRGAYGLARGGGDGQAAGGGVPHRQRGDPGRGGEPGRACGARGEDRRAGEPHPPGRPSCLTTSGASFSRRSGRTPTHCWGSSTTSSTCRASRPSGWPEHSAATWKSPASWARAAPSR